MQVKSIILLLVLLLLLFSVTADTGYTGLTKGQADTLYCSINSCGGSSVNATNISFGSSGQIPYTNAAGDDFDYSSNLIYINDKFGIGTDSPGGLLHLAQSSDTEGLRISGFDDKSGVDMRMYVDAYGTTQVQAEKKLKFSTAGGGDLEFNTADDIFFDVNSASSKFHVRDASNNNLFVIKQSDGNVGIGTSAPIYPLTVAGNVSGISIWSEANVSATGFITRTSTYDKSKGSALDKIKDSDEYLKTDSKGITKMSL
jgi:hypothetical protein